jgi:hypothetical protein
MTLDDADYEKTVRPAITRSSELFDAMLGDLDEDRGGFGWWHGYLDARRICLISEYLMASIGGVQASLLNASMSVKTHRELSYADSMWFRQIMIEAGKAGRGLSTDDYLRAMARGQRERLRERQIDAAAEHTYYHLAQGLDRLAAVLIGVCALRTDIVRADWKVVTQATKRIGTPATKFLDTPGSAGRDAQEDVLRSIDEQRATGPWDWLEWMLRERDTVAHRAPRLSWKMLTVDRKRRPDGLVTPFYRQPGWPDVEAMIRGRKGEVEEVDDMLLMRDPNGVMSGHLGSTTDLVAEAFGLMTELWLRRRSEPTLLVQPGEQWRTLLDQAELEFDGYSGDKLPVSPNSQVHLSIDNGKRLAASKVLDPKFWSSR